jgi:hypothetical protein
MSTATALSAEVQTMLEQLLQLPADQRLEVGERLIASVPPEFDDVLYAEWRGRAQELDDGLVRGIPADAALSAARKALNETCNPAP